MDCNRIDEYVYAFRLAIPRTSHCCLTFSSESVLQMIEFQVDSSYKCNTYVFV